MSDYIDGWMAGMAFEAQARFPQFEDRKSPFPGGPASRAWLDGFAEGILIVRDDDEERLQIKQLCGRFRT